MAKATSAEINSKGAKQKSSAGESAKPNVFARLGQYFRDVRAEMGRVVWPTRPEVINSSLVVIVTLIFFVAFTFVVDSIAVQVLQLIARLG